MGNDSQEKPMLPLSPTPKSTTKKRSIVCMKIFLWTMALFITTMVVVILFSYHQGKLGDNATEVPQEIRKTLDIWYDGAKGKVKLLANKVHFGDKSLAFILFGDESSNMTVPTTEDVIEETNDKQFPDTVMMDEIEVISDDDMDMSDD